MSKRKISSIVIVTLLVLMTFNSYFVLDETQQAIVTQFGKPVGDPRTSPGINFKIPFLHKVQFFDKRYL